MEIRLPLDGTAEASTLLCVTSADLVAIKERTRGKKKQYVFVLNVTWSDDSGGVIWRSYSEFFELQCQLLDAFPEEAGSKGNTRTIPFLPGRKFFTKSDLSLAQERKPHITRYVKELLQLSKNITQGPIMTSFFHKNKDDPECFNQFPSQLNTRAEFNEESEVLIGREASDSFCEESLRSGQECLRSGQENMSYERSLSIGSSSHNRR